MTIKSVKIDGVSRAVLAASAGILAPFMPRAAFADGAAAEGHSAGMPQFDPTWFPSQIFWLIVSFALLYVLMSRMAIPRVARVQASRRARIEADMAAAQKARDEAAALLAAFDKTQAEARLKAQMMLAEAEKETSGLAGKGNAELASILSDRISQAERRISVARAQVLSSLSQLTGDVAAVMLEKVSGLTVDQQTAEIAARKVAAARKG